MRVHVLFFGVLRDLTGKPEDEIELPEGAAVRDILERYGAQVPRLKDSLSSIALAVNQQYTGPETILKPDDEVALLPPVSGGATETAGATPVGTGGYARITR